MSALAAALRYSFISTSRRKALAALGAFACAALAGAVVSGMLGGEAEPRLLVDFGLLAAEGIGTVAIVYLCATAVWEEAESRALALVFARPVSRSQYLIGRFLGLWLAAAAMVGLMAAAHLLLAAAKAAPVGAAYGAAVFSIALKMLCLGAVALLFSLIASSPLTAIFVSALLWVLGHLTVDLRALAERAGGAAGIFLEFLLLLTPDLQSLSLRERLEGVGGGALFSAAGYAAGYAAACLALAALKFERKEL